MCEILWQAGVPHEVLHFVPGAGETVGAAMVRDPRVAIIAFTGSKAIGLDILAAAAQTPVDQPHIKRVICEMGGKNAIIIDESADLDEAVMAVPAVRLQLQRPEVLRLQPRDRARCRCTTSFLHRLVESTRSLTIGDPLNPGTDIGPIIDAEAAERIRRYIDIGMAEGRIELACAVPPGLSLRVGKPYIAPHIFSDVHEHHRLGQEEIFGPVLSVMRAKDFSEALHIANSTTYKLTGGLFSRTPAHLARARREFRVGNLYLNRGITGALVGRQPFGAVQPLGRWHQGRRPRVPAALRRSRGLHRKHPPPRLRPRRRRRHPKPGPGRRVARPSPHLRHPASAVTRHSAPPPPLSPSSPWSLVPAVSSLIPHPSSLSFRPSPLSFDNSANAGTQCRPYAP